MVGERDVEGVQGQQRHPDVQLPPVLELMAARRTGQAGRQGNTVGLRLAGPNRSGIEKRRSPSRN
jgi:hypothetical protein